MLLPTGGAALSCQRTNYPKSDCKCELVGFRCLEELGSKIHFLFREPERDPVPELMI